MSCTKTVVSPDQTTILYSTPTRRMLTSPRPSRTPMLPMTHPTSNGIDKVLRLAMQQIPAYLLHNLAEPMPHLMRLLLYLPVPGASQAQAHHAKKAQTPQGGNCRRTPQMDRHTHCIPSQNLWNHCGIRLRMQVRKRSSLPLDRHQRVHPLGNTLSALLNTVLRVTRRRGHSLLHLPLIKPRAVQNHVGWYDTASLFHCTPSFFVIDMSIVTIFLANKL